MRPASRSTSVVARVRAVVADQSGTAALEFIGVGLLMLVPLVYLVLALGAIQGQSLGAEAASRHLARSLSSAADPEAAEARAETVLTTVASEYGLDRDTLRVQTSCHPASATCPSPGTTLTVTVTTSVVLPLVPPVFGLERVASIPIEATSVQKVSRFWGTG